MYSASTRHLSVIYSIFLVIPILLIQACGSGESTDSGFILRSVTPDEGQGEADINSGIVAIFSEPVDEKSITPKNFWLSDEDARQKVKGKFEFSADKKTVTFKPNSLIYDRLYEVSIHHSITNQAGTHLKSGSKIWSFFTQPRPPIFNQFPQNNAVGINTNISIRVDLENEIQANTLNSATFTLMNGANPIPATVKLDKSTATLTPSQPLQLNTTYMVNLTSGILNLDNTPAFPAGFSWFFTTRPQPSSSIQLGTTRSDRIYDSAADTLGNFVVVGFTEGSFEGITNAGEGDAFLAKYNATGQREWIIQQGSPLFDEFHSVSIGSDNNIYVSGNIDDHATGFFPGPPPPTGQPDQPTNTKSEIIIKSYLMTNQMRWEATFGATDGHNFAASHVIDDLNNLYITGQTMGTLPGKINQGDHDVIIAKFSSEGTPGWQAQIGTPGNDTAGKPFVIGQSLFVPVFSHEVMDFNGPIPPPIFGPGGGQNVKVVVIDLAQGTQTREVPLQINDIEFGEQIHIDNQEQIYITGMTFEPPKDFVPSPSNPPTFGPRVVIKKFSPDGTLQWSTPWPEPLNGEANAITTDSQGNIYIGAFHYDEDRFLGNGNSQPMNHLMLLKMDPNGNKIWSTPVNIEEHADFSSINVLANGEVIATGSSHGGIDGNVGIGRGDGFIIRFDASGLLK